jgi:ribosomal protein S18 acetylase RimI-like enzyme
VQIRTLGSGDFAAAARLLVEAYPYRAHEPSSWTRPAPHEQPERWGIFCASSDQGRSSTAEIVGYAALWIVQQQKFRFDVIVSSGHVRRGLGTQLFEIVLQQAQRRGAATLQARACHDAAHALAFLARREFVETMRMRRFVLQLADVDLRSLVASTDLTNDPDVSIAAVSPEQTADIRLWRRLADLHDAAREGWPDPDPGGPISACEPDAIRSMLIPSPEPPLGFFVASSHNRFVGYSVLVRRRHTGEAQFAATAVRPDARGRGIATALRAHCLLVAQRTGYGTVHSASGSDALIRINRRFGFKETYCEVRLVRRLVPV